jgi:hypothetical protein
MPETTQKYILQFNYADNGQLYEDFLLLTAAEASRLNGALELLFAAGDIRSADGDRTSASMLQPYAEPEFRTLSQMKKGWENGYLADQLRDHDFDWEEPS